MGLAWSIAAPVALLTLGQLLWESWICGLVVPACSIPLTGGCRGASGAAKAAFSPLQGRGAALTELLGGEQR